MLLAIGHCSTSRQDDEAIIVGATMGLDIRPILRGPLEEKVAAFIRTIPCVPADMLFIAGPHLQQPGWRWAPATFLHSKGASLATIISDQVPLNLEQMNRGSITVRLMSTLDTEGKSLPTFNPAIRLRRVHKLFDEGADLGFELMDAAFVLRSVYANNFVDVEQCAMQSRKIEEMLKKSKHLMVLLSEFNPKGRMLIGCIAEKLPEKGQISLCSWNVMELRYRMYVNLTSGYLRSDLLEKMRTVRSKDNEKIMHNTSSREDTKAIKGEGKSRNDSEWIKPRIWLID